METNFIIDNIATPFMEAQLHIHKRSILSINLVSHQPVLIVLMRAGGFYF